MQEAELQLTWKDHLDVVSAGDRVDELLGYAQRDLVSGSVSLARLIHPADLSRVRDLFSAAAWNRRGEIRVRVRGADGRIRCRGFRYVRQRTSQGELQLRGTLFPPGRPKQEPEIHKCSANLLAVLDSVGQPACVKDRHHVICLANHGFRALFADAERDLAGLTDYDLFPEDYADRSYEAEEQVAAGIPVTQFELQVQERTGTKRFRSIENRSLPVRGRRGEIVGVCSVVADTTARKLAEQELRICQESAKEAQRVAGMGSFVFDVASQTWTASDVVYEILGLDKDCPRTADIWSALTPEDDHARLSSLHGEISSGLKNRIDTEVRFVYGEKKLLRWVHFNAEVERDAQRNPQILRGTIRDITAQKLADEKVKESSNLFEMFIRDAPAGAAMFDRDMQFKSVSRRWVEDREENDGQIIGRCLYDLHPRIPESWKKDHRRALAGETTPYQEQCYEDESGSEHWVWRMVQPWREGDGKIGGIVVFSEDITARKIAERGLRESRHVLQLFIEHAPAAIAMFDREMRYLAASRRWIESFGLRDQAILGRSHYEVFPDLPERWKEAHRRGLAGEGVRMEEDLFERPEGRKQWIRWELLPWEKSDGSVGGIVLFTEDITTLKESVERLQLAASVFTHTSESILITDAEGTILDANRAFTRIYGYAREEVVGQNPRLLNSGRQSRDFYAGMWAQLREKGQWSGEIWNRGKSGQILPGTLTVSAVPDATGKTKHYVGLFSDLSPVKEQERQLRHVAHFDMLTGLPNRTLLADRLRQAMGRARQEGRFLVLAYLDLDDFSTINERHGRMIGDELLRTVSQRLSAVQRESDTLARLGGDEFAAVFPDTVNIDEGLALIARLQDAIAEPVRLGDLRLQVTASVGVTLYPQADEVEPDQLVRQADQAMYLAKQAGKARHHIFDPMLDRTMRGRHEDLQRIRQALHAEEFELYFQPKVNMRTGAVLGAEALIRWRHPELGLLMPEHFLPVMEGNLLVVELGEWVIASALAQLENWRDQGLDIPVSVNVDAMQLQEPKFVERLEEALARHPGIQPSRLELEVLESSAFDDVSQVSDVIRACGKLGVSFALDDFGTGYSSLFYLKRLPVDVLKIDRSFVHDMLDDPEDLSILEGVLVLANAFRRQAIAEGVETVDHGLMLLQLGCQIGQGYEIARPMRSKDLPEWAAAWRPDPRWMETSAIDPVKWPILHAGVEHRAWGSELEEFVDGRRASPPSVDARACRLGSWLDAEMLSDRGERPGLRDLDVLHRKFHAHADEILDRKGQNGGTTEPAALNKLRTLRDDLLEKIQDLVQTS